MKKGRKTAFKCQIRKVVAKTEDKNPRYEYKLLFTEDSHGRGKRRGSYSSESMK